MRHPRRRRRRHRRLLRQRTRSGSPPGRRLRAGHAPHRGPVLLQLRSLGAGPEHRRGPALAGHRPGSGSEELICLITSILDHTDTPALDLAAAYHDRWEIENTFDEIKTHQRGEGRVLRSKLPALAEQEIWAPLLSHYAIRSIMVDAADEVDLDPDRISSPERYASSAARSPTRRIFTPDHHTHALRETFTEIVERPNPPRRHRTYPRAIRRGRHNDYRIKRPTDKATQHDHSATLKLARAA
ncbi:transposase [Frankia sp. AgKG'84/4]|uniref:transposase n=1 Tax=Frankia sp. AgKG'84/4 TaxID=573490 RepID=UPI0035B192B8